MPVDLARPAYKDEIRKHKMKKLIPAPKSYFYDVKCGSCYKIQTVFSHLSTTVVCKDCGTVLARPTGGKAALEGDSQFRRK